MVGVRDAVVALVGWLVDGSKALLVIPIVVDDAFVFKAGV